MQRLQKVTAQQIKYYNVNHQSKSYIMSDLVMLSIKNFKQKRFSKKLSHKFVNSFRMKNKIDEQCEAVYERVVDVATSAH